MEKNEHLSKSGFQHAIGIGETILQIGKYATIPAKLNQVFSKQFDHIDVICDTEYNFNSRVMPSATFDQRILKTLRLQDIKPLKLGQARDFLRIDAVLESAYEPDGQKRL